MAASRDGDFERLVAVLDPDVVLRARTAGGLRQLRGAARRLAAMDLPEAG